MFARVVSKLLPGRRHLTTTASRPQDFAQLLRLGVFGHRGVGKTTLLTVLYHQAVTGRLPGLRLAAADAATAQHLADKLLALEAGQPLPATLAESDLRFHLYHGEGRLDWLIRDYQGEHVALGRNEPIRDFFRQCDAVWLCIDAQALGDPAESLRSQQEVEQLLEDYLSETATGTIYRPVALVVTKADLLTGPWSKDLAQVRYALAMHCPNHAVFAVSSLAALRGESPGGEGWPPIDSFANMLGWLVAAAQRQDEARLERLASGRSPRSLARAVDVFARRYPQAPAVAQYRQTVREWERRRRRRRLAAAVGLVACLAAGLWTYDALGQQRVQRFEAEHPDAPAEVLAHWRAYQTWHPTRHLFRPEAAQREAEHLRLLTQQAEAQERQARLAQLARGAADPDADPETLWREFLAFRARFPEAGGEVDLRPLRAALQSRLDAVLRRRAEQAYEELLQAERQGTDLERLAARAGWFLRDFPDSPRVADVRRLREAYLRRLDERDIEAAREYSARKPLNFQTRRELYQAYLDKHPTGGAFTVEAKAALQAIATQWDRHDFRLVRDQFLRQPGNMAELVARCRTYLAVHPQGRFVPAATELLRWSEQVTAPREYRVVLVSGEFDRSIARFFSFGPDLSVELEVAGVRYGPSPVVVNRYQPVWDYEFPRPVRWKLGDPVRIRVTDHDWFNRVVLEITSDDGDPWALRLLSGEVASGPHRLIFRSDFALPRLPTIE
ncbi:MAG: hypothetical protein NZ700_02565 [Gemmataceae bacterium]|nr:hypothetical protein [Gemmataceae bacterium]MDW8265257.1 hypothetical protein [Gemmataceae bacterium]